MYWVHVSLLSTRGPDCPGPGTSGSEKRMQPAVHLGYLPEMLMGGVGNSGHPFLGLRSPGRLVLGLHSRLL